MREYLLPVPGPDPDYQNVAETLELTGEEADQVFDALSSPTSRSVLRALYDDPLPPADLAEELDTSVQNIHYHLQKLEGANLVEAIETAYSSRGGVNVHFDPTRGVGGFNSLNEVSPFELPEVVVDILYRGVEVLCQVGRW